MDTHIKEKFSKKKKIIISVILIILGIGLTFLIINVFAATPPSSCPSGTDTILSECQSCLELTALPTTISAGNSSTLTLKVKSEHDGVLNPSWTIDCSINNGVLSNTTLNNGTYNYSVSPINTTTYTASCTGVGTNPAIIVDSAIVTVVDTTSPTISFNPASRLWANTNVNVAVTASDASGISDTYYCWTTGVPCAPGTSFVNGSTITQSANGDWTLYIKARDNFNNETTDHSGPYQIDKTLPTVDSFSVDGNISNFTTYDTSLAIDWLVSDTGGSSLSNVQVWRQTDGGGWSNIHQESISGSFSSGSWVNTVTCGHNYKYGIHVVDNANNMGEEASPITATVQCNQAPSAGNLTVTPLDYCTHSLPTSFSWDFSDPDIGDVQKYYQIQIDNNALFSSIEVDSGKVLSASELYAPVFSFSYNTTYYWRLMVWDNVEPIGANSGWIFGSLFTTPLHRYPVPDFSPSPQNPSVDEVVEFGDDSKCYNIGGSEYFCKNGSGISYEWDFDYIGGFTLDSNYKGSATTTYGISQPYTIRLRITDDIGGTCFADETINVNFPLPEWGETTP